MKATKTLMICTLCAATLALSACGDTRGERALSGAGVGAGIGALGGAVAGGSATTGALIGGAVGAGVGGLTDKDTVSLD